jgi:glycosyltransferase involved in cell wall biosynthesis
MIKWSYRLEALLYRKALAINVVTPAMQEVLVRKKKVPAQKVIYIPNAADFNLSDALLSDFDTSGLRASLGLEGNLSLCYVGAHGVANHLEQIIDTAELLSNEAVKFVFVGDGMQKQDLIKRAEAKGLTNVHFIGLVTKEEALKYILACDIGLSVLKKVDTFKTVYSNKTFDYMACKRPVLMAIDGVSRALIEDADAGIFAEPENINAIADVIRRYIKDPSLRKQQGENGYAYVKAHFDRTVLAAQYLQEIVTRSRK